MADTKATEKELEQLHAVVASVLKTQLTATATVVNEEGEIIEMSMVTPAIIAQAIKFLKDNNITATPEIGDDLDDLANMLKDKPQRGRAQLKAVPAKQAAGED